MTQPPERLEIKAQVKIETKGDIRATEKQESFESSSLGPFARVKACWRKRSNAWLRTCFPHTRCLRKASLGRADFFGEGRVCRRCPGTHTSRRRRRRRRRRHTDTFLVWRTARLVKLSQHDTCMPCSRTLPCNAGGKHGRRWRRTADWRWWWWRQ